MKFLFILIIPFLISCKALTPKVTYPLMDLKDIDIYGIYYNCEKNKNIKVIKCNNAGIKEGVFYCKDIKDFYCPKEMKKIFFAFDIKSRAQLETYINYMYDSYNRKDEL